MNKDFITSSSQLRWKHALESHKRCTSMLDMYAKLKMAPPHNYWNNQKNNLEQEFPQLKGVIYNESL